MPKIRQLNPLGRVFNSKRAFLPIRRAGDKARDEKRWSEAAAHYASYLKHLPADVKIRVQLGNCLKEAGRLTEALAAYDFAIALDDAHDDAHLQRGHLLKIMGRVAEAGEEYRKSFEQRSLSNPAFEEMLGLGVVPNAAPGAELADSAQTDSSAILLDITDLMDYLKVNVSLSGIQRVVSNLIVNARAFSADPMSSQVRPVLPDYTGSKVFSVSLGLLEGLVSLVANGRGNRETLDLALAGVLASKSVIAVRSGDTLVIPGAFWIYQRYDLLNSLRQGGALVTVFIHDLIQVTNPEFVEPAATTVFRRSLVDVLSVSSYILTNSRFVAEDVRRYLAERMNFDLPVTPVTLATEFTMRKLDRAEVQDEYLELATEEYVLCVGTIEIRKNHIYLVELWERLIREFSGPVPNLVFIGKWGWEIAPLLKHLSSSDYLGGRLFVYCAIADCDLAFLYQNCLFTIYPSFAEGWGLPVGESLWYGKPCIASKVTAIPEVGGALCKYIDPFDVNDGYAVVSQVLANRPALQEWTTRVQTKFTPKTWKTFSEEFYGAIRRHARDRRVERGGNNCILETGEVATFGNDPLAQLDMKKKRLLTARMSRAVGWYGIEPWGCWAAKRRATLRIKTRLAQGTEVIVYLQLRTPDGDECADCTVKVNQTPTFLDELGSVATWFAARGTAGLDGMIEILLISGRGFQHRFGRDLFVGILSIAVTPADDTASWNKLLTQIVREGTTSPAAR